MPFPNRFNDQSPILPQTFRVRFPTKLCSSTPSPVVKPPRWFTVDVQLSQISNSLNYVQKDIVGAPGVYTVHDECYAICDGTNATPTNSSILNNLAKQMAIDFYNWRSVSFDIVYNGVIAPFNDALIDLFILDYENGDCVTRIISAPWNGEPEEFYHIDQDCFPHDPIVYVPTAKRVGDFLRIPKAYITDDCGVINLQTSSYDDIHICCRSTSTSSSGSSSHKCPTFECKNCVNPADCNMTVVLPGRTQDNLFGPTFDNPVCSGITGTFVMTHASGCTWTFTNVDPSTGFGLTLTLSFGSNFQLEVIATGPSGTGIAYFDGTGFNCSAAQGFPFLIGQSTCHCNAIPSNGCVADVGPG